MRYKCNADNFQAGVKAVDREMAKCTGQRKMGAFTQDFVVVFEVNIRMQVNIFSGQFILQEMYLKCELKMCHFKMTPPLLSMA